MAVKLNDRAFEFAKNLVEQGKFVFIERAAAHLHGMIDAAKGRKEGQPHY